MDVEAQQVVLRPRDQRLTVRRVERGQDIIVRVREVTARHEVREQTAREHDHVGVAVGWPLRDEVEVAVRVGAAAPPLRTVVTRLPELDDRVEDEVLSALDPADRETLIARPDGDTLRFDINLAGDRQTVFFAV